MKLHRSRCQQLREAVMLVTWTVGIRRIGRRAFKHAADKFREVRERIGQRERTDGLNEHAVPQNRVNDRLDIVAVGRSFMRMLMPIPTVTMTMPGGVGMSMNVGLRAGRKP